ncbi:MAG TPA: response regulator [Tepidisphaeraceae bacterium]|nr:response regulator [Tepidisphaeraceae bacterium]
MSDTLHILLVEDDADNATVLAKLLERTGHRVARAQTVRTAIEAVDHNRFDVMISDLGLPDGSGLDLMRQVRQRSTLPGIALTGDDSMEASYAAGFGEHLTKPISFTVLIDAIHRLTSPRPAPRLAS